MTEHSIHQREPDAVTNRTSGSWRGEWSQGHFPTRLIGQVFQLARREGVRGVVSFSDPVARRDATGRVVFPGHIGIVYQACAPQSGDVEFPS